jgi:hypothetical protein
LRRPPAAMNTLPEWIHALATKLDTQRQSM